MTTGRGSKLSRLEAQIPEHFAFQLSKEKVAALRSQTVISKNPKLAALERKVAGHDEDLKQMFAALRALLDPPTRPRRAIGFGNR
jgi:hypothetical protein